MNTMEMFDLNGQVAVVSGGHAWLGYDMACALAEAGCNIIITSRNLDRALETARKLSQNYNIEATGLAMDQKDFSQVADMAKKAYGWKNRIDILINNAGGGSGASEGDFLKRSPEDIVNLIMTNLVGAMFCCRELGRFMVARRSGKIINIASIAGLIGRNREMYRSNGKTEQPVDYAASKAGVIGMTRDLAAYMAPFGVFVNSISPGGFDKGDMSESFAAAYSAATVLGRPGHLGSDIKGAVLYLASAASSYVTGQNFVVDGGFSIWK